MEQQNSQIRDGGGAERHEEVKNMQKAFVLTDYQHCLLLKTSLHINDISIQNTGKTVQSTSGPGSFLNEGLFTESVFCVMLSQGDAQTDMFWIESRETAVQLQ